MTFVKGCAKPPGSGRKAWRAKRRLRCAADVTAVEVMLDNMRVAYNPRLPLHAAAAMETGRISIFNLL